MPNMGNIGGYREVRRPMRMHRGQMPNVVPGRTQNGIGSPSGIHGRMRSNAQRKPEGLSMKLKSLIYRILSISNNLSAIQGGPKAIGKRLVRKAGWRKFASIMRKI